MPSKFPTPTNRAGVLIFQTAHRRRKGARQRLLEQTYRSAIEEQLRVATHLEEVLAELERASLQAEEAAWALSSASQCHTSCMSFGEIMCWLSQLCSLRNAGDHFCVAEMIRSSSALEPREPTY